jgi:SAM-dependent methyltransferase
MMAPAAIRAILSQSIALSNLGENEMCAATFHRFNNLRWEFWFDISTRGRVATDHPDAGHYATMRYSTIFTVLHHLHLTPSDVFVDIGCGKGRVLCCAARHRVKQVIGIDLSESLCRQAKINAQRMRGRRTPIVVETALAQEFDYGPATVLFLFDPFGARTLGQVLAKVEQDTRGHDVRVAYANPTYDEVFRAQAWLGGREFWSGAQLGLEHDIAFYRSR